MPTGIALRVQELVTAVEVDPTTPHTLSHTLSHTRARSLTHSRTLSHTLSRTLSHTLSCRWVPAGEVKAMLFTLHPEP